MATAYTSANSGNWNDATKWTSSGGTYPNAAGDTFNIQAAHTITYNYDNSANAGFGASVINGVLNASTTAGTYILKTNANITGTGQINAGTAGGGNNYPYGSGTNCKFQIQVNGNFANTLTGAGKVGLYCLEPTNKYVILVSSSNFTITGLTNASPGVVTAVGHTFSNGNLVRIIGVGGMLPINYGTYAVGGVSGNTFNIGVDTTTWGTYSSGGVASLRDATASGDSVIYIRAADGSTVDLSSDIAWGVASPDTANIVVYVCNHNRVAGSFAQKYINAPASAGQVTLTTTAGAIYLAGSPLYLSSRNVSIAEVGTSGGSTYGVNGASNSYIGSEIRGVNFGVASSSGSTIAGAVTPVSYGVYTSIAANITGVVGSPNATALTDAYGTAFSGYAFGNNIVCSSSWGVTLSGTFIGNSTGVYQCRGATCSGTFIGGNTIASLSVATTYSGNCYFMNSGLSLGSNVISGGLFGCSTAIFDSSGRTTSTAKMLNNSYDFYYQNDFVCSPGTIIGDANQSTGFVNLNNGRSLYGRNQIVAWDPALFTGGAWVTQTGTVKAWMYGGTVASDATTTLITAKPDANVVGSIKFSPVVAGYPCYIDIPIFAPANVALQIVVAVKDSASMSENMNVKLFYQGQDPDFDGGSTISTYAPGFSNTTVSTILSYTNTTGYDKFLTLRFRCADTGSKSGWGQFMITRNNVAGF